MSFRDKLRMMRDTQKCPRCGERYISAQEKCSECGLIFSRLQYASNKVAKRQLMHFNYDYVVYTSKLPKDVKKWKLVLYSIFLGLFGGHYFYVGKFGKAITMCIGFVYLIVCTILNPILAPYMEANYLYVPIGIYAMAWIVSMVFVFFNKFKVPILIDNSVMEEEINKKREDFDRG